MPAGRFLNDKMKSDQRTHKRGEVWGSFVGLKPSSG
jgi:hypothetical protein